MIAMRQESDSLGLVEVPADKLWGAQTQRSLEHFSIGKDLIPREMIIAYATLRKAAATANYASRRLARDIPGCISSAPLTIPENSRRRQVRRCGVEITCCT